MANQEHDPDLGSERHQFGMSALLPQTSFREETSGDVKKCRFFSQAIIAGHPCHSTVTFGTSWQLLATQSTVVFCFVWFPATLILNFLLNLGRNNCLKKVILCKNITPFLNNCISKKHQLCVFHHAFRYLS